MSQADPARIQRIKAQLDHPVIDADGHMVEFLPAVRDEIAELAGAAVADGVETALTASQKARHMDAELKRRLGLFRLSWWAFPTSNTLDRAAALLPGLLHERLPELGIDFAILYPTFGLIALQIDAAEHRQAACRGFNQYYAALCREHASRLTPAALIPMHTPEEALDELDFAVGTLGLRAVLLPGFVSRPLPGENQARSARWIDSYGPDDPTAYDAVWQRCRELGVAPTFHSSAMGWGTRLSMTNYVFNHIGNFAAAGEGTCRSLFLSGVPHRFPELRFAFLEGGVAWGANLYSDLLGHFEKRGGTAIRQFDPAHVDRAQMKDLFERYGPETFQRRIDQLDESLTILSDPTEDPASLDEFRHSGVEKPEDIRRIFSEQLFFGCEADDPMNALAFDTRTNPMGARLRAIFSSDIGHWDVPDMNVVLPEAWELVEEERLDRADFRDFTFANAVELFTSGNRDFFAGTEVAEAVAKELGR
ncbi:MAG: amidohydrolase family protein [Deltaproteobacteria bacterium]|nr:amidohydrolase family protein [Deltaproteobacteria bacterium]